MLHFYVSSKQLQQLSQDSHKLVDTTRYWSGFKLFFFPPCWRHGMARMAIRVSGQRQTGPSLWVKSPNGFCDFLATTI
jgi:hypothetical protein